MLKNIKDLLGYEVHAMDGGVGRVEEFFFDENTWVVRFMKVAGGDWLSGRRVLIPFSAFREPDWGGKTFRLNISREAVRNSPDLDVSGAIPVRYADELAQYYHWPVYQDTQHQFVKQDELASSKMRTAVIEDEVERRQLIGIRDVSGYTVAAPDGVVGTVEDMVVDDVFWDVRYIVVDTGKWLAGKRILVSPNWTDAVVPGESLIRISVLRENILRNKVYDVLDVKPHGE